MKKIDSYKFRRKWWTMIQAIPSDYQAEVVRAICAYELEDTLIPLSTLSQGLFLSIKIDIDREKESRAEISAKRAEAGSKGAEKTNQKRWGSQTVEDRQMPTFADNCQQMPTFADFCRLLPPPIVSDIENIYNNYIQQHPSAHTREEVCFWICQDEDRLKLTLYRAGAIAANVDQQTLIKTVYPYVCKFYESLIMADRNLAMLDRKDTISHFSNWLHIHIKKVKQDDPKNTTSVGFVSDGTQKTADYKQRF